MMRRRWWSLLTMVPILLRGGVPIAEDDLPATPIVVMIQEAHNPRVDLNRALQGQLTEIDATLVIHPVEAFPATLSGRLEIARHLASTHGAIASFFCVFHRDRDVRLFLTSPDESRMLFRSFQGTTDAQLYEVIAIVVRGAVETIHSGGNVGVNVSEISAAEAALPPETETDPGLVPETVNTEDRSEPVSSATDPISSDDAERSGLPVVRLGGTLTTRSPEHPIILGFSLWMGFRLVPGMTVGAGTRWSPPLTTTRSGLQTTLRQIPLSAGIQVHRDLRFWRVGATGDMVLDIQARETLSSHPQARPAIASRHVGLQTNLSADILWKFHHHVGLFLGLGIGILIVRNRFFVEEAGEKFEILKTRPVVPWVIGGLELSFDAFSRPPVRVPEGT